MSKYSDKFQKIKKKALINTGFPARHGRATQGGVTKINDINLKMNKAVANNATNWNRLISAVTAGTWRDPETGQAVSVPFRHVEIGDDLAALAAERLAAVMPAERYAVVCDAATADAMGSAITARLGPKARQIVLDRPHADLAGVRALQAKSREAEALVAVGSGTINDLCKYATFLDGRAYSVFATAPSMNGYTSSTASITLDSGLKTTQKAHAAKGVFIDIGVSAAAPRYLIGAGMGDCLCRSTAQVDWYFSHIMFGGPYAVAPYVLQQDDERETLARARQIGRREHAAIGYLQRWLTLGGLGIAAVGMSHPGSMGEHQISHWIDSFAGARHPHTVHGQQVGIASITMARLQARILDMPRPPEIRPWRYDEAAIRARYPEAAVEDCLKACRAKSMAEDAARAFNARLRRLWPDLCDTMAAMRQDPDEMAACLSAAGGAVTYDEIGLDRDLYVDALRHCREIRDRYSFLDLAADAGLLDAFIEECV